MTKRLNYTLWSYNKNVSFDEMMSDRIIKLFFVVGGIVFVLLIGFVIVNEINVSPITFIAPGDASVYLSEDTYIVFYEYDSVLDGRPYRTDYYVPTINIEIINKTNGLNVQLQKSSYTTSYEINGRKGYSILTFSIFTPGVYNIFTSYPRNRTGNDIVLRIQKESEMNNFVYGIFLSIIICFVWLGGTILIYTIRKGNK